MESRIDDLKGSVQAQRRVDAVCQEFEQAWTTGDVPKLEDFVANVPSDARTEALRELLIIERNYRELSSGPLSDEQLCELHPELMREIQEQLKPLRDAGRSDEVAAATRVLPASARESEPTIDHTSSSKGSRGLHIRCPHCSNPVELLADTPFESVTCRTCGSAFSLVDEDEQTREAPTLKKVGRFELVSRLGVGGFGTVWKARDTELDRTVAVKIPRKGQLARDEVEQFFREARSAAQLRHPNIVPVHEVGRTEDTIFIVSDLIRGVSMSDWLSGATPNWHETAQLMSVVCEALHHAHQKGVIHRDLKPSNILLDDAGQPHIMDFGLAKREVGEITMTVEGHILGTPAYMSPEQAAGEGHWTDRRTDIYALGVILFRMLTGELPFRGNAQMQIHQRLNADPPDPRQLNRHLPRDLCTICLKCMERDPNRRYATSQDLADEFGRFMRREPILSRPISRIERTIRWAKRKPALATALVLTTFLAIAGPVAAVVFQRQQASLSARVIENDNLISQYERERLSASGKVEALQSQLDVWEGKTNPWAFWLWPPKRDAPPRRDMVKDLLEQSDTTLAKHLRGGRYDSQATAAGYLGLGILAEGAEKESEAIEHYLHARDALVRQQQDDENGPRVARALADCYTRLARLTNDSDPLAAAKHLQSAEEIYRRLAKEKTTDAKHQIELLEAELAAALREPAETRADRLKRVQKIHGALPDQWPTDPGTVYQLACYLTQSEPILLLPADADVLENKAADAAATIDTPIAD